MGPFLFFNFWRVVLFLGIDFGTSGARAIVLSGEGDHAYPQIIAQSTYQFDRENKRNDDWRTWQSALYQLIGKLSPDVRKQIGRIAINGTSATMLLCDKRNQPLTSAWMYNDASARSALDEVSNLAPSESPVLSATSTLTKAIWLYRNGERNGKPGCSADYQADHQAGYQKGRPNDSADERNGVYIAHQADWLACLMHGQRPVTDYHNALKLGYDVRALAYPDWLLSSPVASWLPEVLAPGEAIAPITPRFSDLSGIPKTCQICAGTTDSIAAFLASGAQSPGEAVTSLGSTLVLKLLIPQPIDHQAFGIYSHRLGDLWLAGGASNTGGAVLKQFFSSEQLADLSAKIDISIPNSYEYYPLNTPGERFPINDPDYPPKLMPRPKEDAAFLYGLLDAMARIEAEGYQKLSELGAKRLTQVCTAGGGAQNKVWQTLRQRRLGVPVSAAIQTEAAYGTAWLAMSGLSRFTQA